MTTFRTFGLCSAYLPPPVKKKFEQGGAVWNSPIGDRVFPVVPRKTHISDEELLLSMDGEIEQARLAELNLHLSRCRRCRARRDQFQNAFSEYVALQRNAPLPFRMEPSALAYGWRPAAAMIAAMALLIWIGSGSLKASGPLPDARLTPGAVRFISPHQVCGFQLGDESPSVPPDLARRVFEQYRIANPKIGRAHV